MTESFIKEVNKTLFPFVKKMLQGKIKTVERWNRVAEEITQESWRILLAKYATYTKDTERVRPLLFVIAKHEVYHYLKIQEGLSTEEINKEKMLFDISEKKLFYETFSKQEVDKILAQIPEDLAFIIQQNLSYQAQYKQEDIAKIIMEEYVQRFKNSLTSEEYQQLESKAIHLIVEFLN